MPSALSKVVDFGKDIAKNKPFHKQIYRMTDTFATHLFELRDRLLKSLLAVI